jgi:hypothetical protein
VTWFIDLEVAAEEGLDEEVSLRFKAVEGARPIRRVWLDEGGGDWFALQAVGEPLVETPAGADPGVRAVPVEDSSDGTALLIVGGSFGLRLVAEKTGKERREPYLLLSLRARVE